MAEALTEGSRLGSPGPARVSIFQEPIVQGALVSIDVASGDVRALVGGYDFDGSEFNRATQAQRQPGSAFKPFIYGAALDLDYTPVTTLWDRPAVYKDPESRLRLAPAKLRPRILRTHADAHRARPVGQQRHRAPVPGRRCKKRH